VAKEGEPSIPIEVARSARFHAIDEHDTPAEVDATVRTLRRVAVGYFLIFLITVGGIPALTVALDWWSEGRLIGGMSPSFVMAAFGLYVLFFVIGIASATLSTAVEARMLGGHGTADDVDEGQLP
jgi:hypothetical protein